MEYMITDFAKGCSETLDLLNKMLQVFIVRSELTRHEGSNVCPSASKHCDL